MIHLPGIKPDIGACGTKEANLKITIGPHPTCPGCLDIVQNYSQWHKTHRYVAGKKVKK